MALANFSMNVTKLEKNLPICFNGFCRRIPSLKFVNKPNNNGNLNYRHSHSSATCDRRTYYLDSRIDYFLSTHFRDLHSVIQYHGYIITTGNANNAFISSKLISLYASLHKPIFSTQVFDSVPFKDTFLWNSILKAQFSNGLYSRAIDYYAFMRVSGTLPNQFTIPMVVSACAELQALDHGMVVHGLASKIGAFSENSAVGSSFVYMYSKCGCMEDAGHMFDEIPVRDVVSWTALVIGYVHNGESEKGLACFAEMHKSGGDGERPNFRTLEGGFQACANLEAVTEGRCLHGLAVKSGIGCFPGVQSSILSMYSKCGTLEEACLSFCEVPEKDLVSWTSIIGVYSKLGYAAKSLCIFTEMLAAGIHPDGMVVSCVVSGFTNSMRICEGKAFHGFIIRRYYDVDSMVSKSLLSMYCKFGLLGLAEILFKSEGIDDHDRDSWNVIAFSCGKVGWEAKCIEFFTYMIHLGVGSDSSTLVSVISSCSKLGAMHLGRSIHCFVTKNLMHENVSVSNSLIDMYGKAGNLTQAWSIFCRSARDTVTWNTMISNYSHNGHYAEAISLFDEMVSEGTKPNSATLVSVLSACSHIASLPKGEQVHKYIEEEMLELNIPLATALIDMYAKCGQLQMSRKIFDMMEEKDDVSWNVMISGYAMHGGAESAICIFQLMEKSDVRPNELTFLAVLSACSYAGLVEEGKYLFARMGHYYLKPTLKHYACMVDLLGRSGNLLEAERLVLSMPIAPDGALWGVLLGACKIHNELEMGIRIAKYAIESDPENDGYYIMISNLYNSLGMWDEAERMRDAMKERGVRKAAGWSAV